MKIVKQIKKNVFGVKISYRGSRKEIGRAYLYVLNNGLHKKPFGFLEDVFVNEKYRGQGLGSKLINAAIIEAKRRGCYKLIATSRNSKPLLRKFYKRFGLEVWGAEFRKDL
jgi:GNAT superfamily N-acetyltransferase